MFLNLLSRGSESITQPAFEQMTIEDTILPVIIVLWIIFIVHKIRKSKDYKDIVSEIKQDSQNKKFKRVWLLGSSAIGVKNWIIVWLALAAWFIFIFEINITQWEWLLVMFGATGQMTASLIFLFGLYRDHSSES